MSMHRYKQGTAQTEGQEGRDEHSSHDCSQEAEEAKQGLKPAGQELLLSEP